MSEGGLSGTDVGKKPTFYEDAVVIAYRAPKNDAVLSSGFTVAAIWTVRKGEKFPP